MKIVSACLVGINCRFDGKNKLDRQLLEVFKRGRLLPVCPEQLGGLPTPRAPAKIVEGDGYDVLDGKARVINQIDEIVTENYVRGATEVLKIVKFLDIKEAILESKSPSCGSGQLYDEASGNLIKGDGVLTALLKRNGIHVIPYEAQEKQMVHGNVRKETTLMGLTSEEKEKLLYRWRSDSPFSGFKEFF